jgi:hypothetical protein
MIYSVSAQFHCYLLLPVANSQALDFATHSIVKKTGGFRLEVLFQ